MVLTVALELMEIQSIHRVCLRENYSFKTLFIPDALQQWRNPVFIEDSHALSWENIVMFIHCVNRKRQYLIYVRNV